MDKIPEEELLKICTKFRNGLLGKSTSKNKCYMVSAPLSSFLNVANIKNYLIKGYVTIGENITNHYWILLPDGRIVDPTADQFNEVLKKEMPKVYIGVKPDWYMEEKSKKKRKSEIFVEHIKIR